MIGDDCIQFTKQNVINIQESKRNVNDNKTNPFLIFSDSAPSDLLESLFLYFKEETRDEASLRSYYILVYNFIKNNLNGSLASIIGSFEDQSNSHERRYFSLTLLHKIINLTPFDEELDIPPEFIIFLSNYFPHSLAISVCNDLIKRDACYYQQLVQVILNFDENSSQNLYFSANNFFLNMMQQNLYDTLLLLQSFLQCKENLIYMEPTFQEILAIISTCELQEKIECFNVLCNFFDCDDLYYSKLISNKSKASSIFSNLELNPLLIESSLNFANKVCYSNDEEILHFIKITNLDQMIINVIPLVNSNQIIYLCCKIFEKAVQTKRRKGVSFLLKRDLISMMNSIKSSISLGSYNYFMHMVSKCIIKGSKSQVISILSIIPLIDFAQYADSLDKDEAIPFLSKIADVILEDFQTSKNEFTIDEETYHELIDLAEQESENEDQIAEFMKIISPIFKQYEPHNEYDS